MPATYRDAKTSTRLPQLSSLIGKKSHTFPEQTDQRCCLPLNNSATRNARKDDPLPHAYSSRGAPEVCQPVGQLPFTFSACDPRLAIPQFNAPGDPYAHHRDHISAIWHYYITPRLSYGSSTISSAASANVLSIFRTSLFAAGGGEYVFASRRISR